MSDDNELRLKSSQASSKIHQPYESPSPERPSLEGKQSQALPPLDQEDTMDDLDNTDLPADEGEWPSITRLVDDWHLDAGATLANKRPGQSPEDIDITADFPAGNPFRGSQDAALLDIANGKHTPANTLKWLSNHTDPEIRKATACNTNTPCDVLRKLAKDWDGTVRLAVLEHPKVPIDIVTELSNDTNPLVSLRACHALDARRKAPGETKAPPPAVTIKDIPSLHTYYKYTLGTKPNAVSAQDSTEAIEFLKIVAEKITTPPQRLHELAGHASPEVRAAVARNSKAPLDLLWRLSLDLDSRVKASLAKNESCPIELLKELLRDGDKQVKEIAQSEITRLRGNTSAT